jgi:glycosyltransferase involved in cell wall biosynthesis
MRILIINSEYPPIGGGAGNASANIAREFAAHGLETTVLTSRFDSLAKDEWLEGVHIRRASALRRRADRSGALEQSLFIMMGFWEARRMLRSWRPDIVLAFFGVPCGVVAFFLHLLARIPYIVSLRGGDVPGFRPYDFSLYHRIIAPLLRLVWRHAAAVVANSHGLYQLARAFEPALPIQIIPNGVDLQRFLPAARQWDPPHLLFTGRLVYQKGLDLLLAALGNLKEIPWELSIAGDGPQKQPLETLAKGLGIENRVHFLGWLDRKDLIPLYQDANLFVFPSRHEGMPNAILEAMASGLPVIATQIAGNEELVSPGVTGILASSEDSAGLQSALSALLVDPQVRQQMGAAARQRVERNYSWSCTGEEYLSLLNQTVDKR